MLLVVRPGATSSVLAPSVSLGATRPQDVIAVMSQQNEVPAVAGPEDSRWQGSSTLVQDGTCKRAFAFAIRLPLRL